jgi:hypothetical protein
VIRIRKPPKSSTVLTSLRNQPAASGAISPQKSAWTLRLRSSLSNSSRPPPK